MIQHKNIVFYIDNTTKDMKITFILIGKTEEEYITKGFGVYEQRLKHYISFETIVIPALKNTKSLSIDQKNKKKVS